MLPAPVKMLLCVVLAKMVLLAQSNKLVKTCIIGIDGASGTEMQKIVDDSSTYVNSAFRDMRDAGAMHVFRGTPADAPTKSGPGWSSILTGVRLNKHGVTDNSFKGNQFGKYPDLFKYIASPSRSVVHWKPINSRIIHHATSEEERGSDLEVKAAAVTDVSQDSYDAFFYHFDDVDAAGHLHGRDHHKYMATLRRVESYVGEIWNAIKARPGYHSEDWLIVLCSDHGHKPGGHHGGGSWPERNGMLMMLGSGINAGELTDHSTSMVAPVTPVLHVTGPDRYVSIPERGRLRFGAKRSFSVEVTVKLRAFKSDPSLVSNKDWSSGQNSGWGLFGYDSGLWKVQLGDGSNRVDLVGSSLGTDTWHHIAMVVDRNLQKVQLFEDGRFASEDSIASIGSLDAGLMIGVGQDGTGKYNIGHTDAQFDDLRIWGDALTEDTLHKFACKGSLDLHPNVQDLEGRWLFNLNARDSSSNGHHGTEMKLQYVEIPTPIQTCPAPKDQPHLADVAATALCHNTHIRPDWDIDGVCRQSKLPPETTTTTTTGMPSTTNIVGFGIQSGNTIFLKTRAGKGKHIDVEGGSVQARWDSHGTFQALVIQKTSGGAVNSGDIVYLKSHAGTHIDVEDEMVQARWNDHGKWQEMKIEKRIGSGPVLSGDSVCFRAHTGRLLDVENSIVQARWRVLLGGCSNYQAMRMEREVEGALFSGASIHLVAHTGKHVEVEGTTVKATSRDKGVHATFTIVNYGGRAIFSGDMVFLKAHTGKFLDVQGEQVSARWSERGEWQKLVVEKLGGDTAAVMPGDVVFFRGHTGNLINVRGEAVQASWKEFGEPQSFKVEASNVRRLMPNMDAMMLVEFICRAVELYEDNSSALPGNCKYCFRRWV